MSAISMEKLSKVYSSGVSAVAGLDLDVKDRRVRRPRRSVRVRQDDYAAHGRRAGGDQVRRHGQAPVTGLSTMSRRAAYVAMVFQNYALYPHLTVAENIGFALTNKKVPRAERDRRVRATAGVLGLGDLLGRTSRAAVRRPAAAGRHGAGDRARTAVFLMDEPLSNLDAKLRVRMRSEMLRVHKARRARARPFT